MRYLKYVLVLAVSFLALAGCGGGGDTGSTSSSNGSNGSGSNGSGSSGSGGTTSGTPVVNLALYNSSNSQVSNVTYGGGNYAKATVLDATGAPVANKLVTFSLNGASIAILPTAGSTALTNASGVAQITIAPASITSAGAATLSAQATVGTTAVTGQVDFSVSASSLALGVLSIGNQSLAAGGSTPVSVPVTSGGNAASGANVSFGASCGLINAAVTTDGTGIASTTYSSLKTDGTSCVGPVTITALASGATAVTNSLTIAAPVANAINFVSATPNQIFVHGSGATEQSNVLFKVLSSGAALPNVSVTFSLSTNPGGVGLGSSGSTSSVTYTTDANGQVSIAVFSGAIPGPVQIKAALVIDPNVFANSANLTVASGPPSQNFFSLAVDTFNIEGWNRDGTSANLTVRVADRQGNAVPDGTVINFTAEGGQIGSNCATTRVNNIASCTVPFVSQNPRPAGGRVSILAYAEGVKQYVDANGNNVFDAGDTLMDLGDAYRDDNENGQYDAGEFVIPKGGTITCAGSGEPAPSRANTCTGLLPTSVRQQAVILYSSTGAAVTVVTAPTSATNTFVVIRVNSADNLLLPMPSGTGVSAVPVVTGCTIGTISPANVPNVYPGIDPTVNLGTLHSIGLSGCHGTPVTINITSPSGLITPVSINVP